MCSVSFMPQEAEGQEGVAGVEPGGEEDLAASPTGEEHEGGGGEAALGDDEILVSQPVGA